MDALKAVLVARGKIVMDRADFEAIQNELVEKCVEYERLSKQSWMLANCDEAFNANTLDRVDTLTLDQIQFLWGAYQDTRNIGAQGVAYNEEDRGSVSDVKEDVRQLIFGTRRSGKWRNDLKSVRDIKL